ncbi:hypothetical protein EVA_11456 [gut metagenome]|uniref:Uncharacterized protein n=1 Tax=gut metagenome TaxID=749906 RepID=J9FZL8_9ZZZZ
MSNSLLVNNLYFPLGSCNPIFFSVLSLRCFERALPVHWLCP